MKGPETLRAVAAEAAVEKGLHLAPADQAGERIVAGPVEIRAIRPGALSGGGFHQAAIITRVPGRFFPDFPADRGTLI
jgi:hypothetical protein